MDSKIFSFFTHQYNLEKSQKLLKHVLILGIETTKMKLQHDISNNSIKILAKSFKKNTGEDRIRKELEQIKGELYRLTKHFDGKPHLLDSSNLTQSSPKNSANNFKKHPETNSEAKINNLVQLYKTNSDIFSQEQLKWWSSPQQQNVKNRSVERNTNTSNQLLPPKANRGRRDTINLTPKVTESPAPQIQVQKVSFKHHLDDSEIKKTLWVQNNEHSETKISQPYEQNKFTSLKNYDQQQIEKRLFQTVLAPIEQSVCSSQQSFHQEEQQRQLSPRFRINESSIVELPKSQQINQSKKCKKQKENQKPLHSGATLSSARKSQQLQQQQKKRSSNPRKSWSLYKGEQQAPQYKNVQSKIKDQIEYDKNMHKQNSSQVQKMRNQTNESLHSLQSIKTESDDSNNQLQDKQQTYTTFQMNNSNQNQDNYMLSNRNPLISVNTKPQLTSNGTLEEVFQYTMNRPLQLENQNETAHIRYISSITSNNSSEATPVNQNRDIYSQAMTAQSMFLQSALSNNNEKRVFSSGNSKGRFRSDMRSDELIGKDVLYKQTSEKKHISKQLSGVSNPMADIASSYINRQNRDINDGSQWQSSDEQQNMDKRLREILAHHDYHSSISSNFSLFNPKDELKNFFQKEFMERQVQDPSERKFLTSRVPKNNEDNSSNISFNNGSDYINRGRVYDL